MSITRASAIITYYKNICPIEDLFHWLTIDDEVKVTKTDNVEIKICRRREFAFLKSNNAFYRFRFFNETKMLQKEIYNNWPKQINAGAVMEYFVISEDIDTQEKPPTIPVKRELIFDIDITDYKKVRTCCTNKLCNKCWKFLKIAYIILNEILHNFNFKKLLWVFSGGKGFHCWVCDKQVLTLNDHFRKIILSYIVGNNCIKNHLNYLQKFSLGIIDKYFNDILIEQDFLMDDNYLDEILKNVDATLRERFEIEIKSATTSSARWLNFENMFHKLQVENTLPKSMHLLDAKLKFQFFYPKLDVNVSTTMNHLLKVPFSVHPTTGFVAIVLSNDEASDFSVLNFKVEQFPTVEEIVKTYIDNNKCLNKIQIWPAIEYFKHFVTKQKCNNLFFD